MEILRPPELRGATPRLGDVLGNWTDLSYVVNPIYCLPWVGARLHRVGGSSPRASPSVLISHSFPYAHLQCQLEFISPDFIHVLYPVWQLYISVHLNSVFVISQI